jgi:hypothetical protein
MRLCENSILMHAVEAQMADFQGNDGSTEANVLPKSPTSVVQAVNAYVLLFTKVASFGPWI